VNGVSANTSTCWNSMSARFAPGLAVWQSTLLYSRSSHEVVRACARLGVPLEPASTYAVDGRDDRHLRIPFSSHVTSRRVRPVRDRMKNVRRLQLDAGAHDQGAFAGQMEGLGGVGGDP